jgi:hypothetical protein
MVRSKAASADHGDAQGGGFVVGHLWIMRERVWHA